MLRLDCLAGYPSLSELPQHTAAGLQQSPEVRIESEDGLKGANKRGVAQAGKPRAIKTPLQKEALEAAFKSACFA